jgi:cell division protease FtsH
MIDKEVRRIVDDGMRRAQDLLREHMDVLHRMSTLLIERETLDSDEIEMVIRGEELPPMEVKKMLQARMATGQSGTEKPAQGQTPSTTVVGPNAGGSGNDIGTGADPSRR